MAPVPIVSTQDGPRMTGVSNFGGKKAAPFRAGGKRRAKVLVAKAAIRRAKSKPKADLSNLDLAFNPGEPRGTNGRWLRAALRATTPKERRQIRRAHEFDYNAGITSNEEHNAVLNILDEADSKAKKRKAALALRGMSLSNVDLAFRASEARDSAGKWRSIGTPSKIESKYLASKNSLAQAQLSGNARKISKAKKKVAKHGFALSQERFKQKALVRATLAASSPGAIQARQNYSRFLAGSR